MKAIRLATLVLLAVTLPAPAYVLLLNDTGFAKHWNLRTPEPGVSTNVVNTSTHAIRYFLASDAYSTTNTVAELNAVRAALGQWLAVSNTYIKFEEGGLVSPPVNVNPNDKTNVIYWTKSSTLVYGGSDDISGALGVAFTSFTADDNTIVGGDIVFNGVEKGWFTDFNDTGNTNIFVEGVALHELGHFLGLAHSPLGGATMFFRGASGVNIQAGLSTDDMTGARFIYPITHTNVGAIKGTITKSGGPVFGAQVFVETAVSNVIAGAVALTNGTYEVNMLPPGMYRIRVTPLDPVAGSRLVSAPDIGFEFTGSDTAFLPTTNVTLVVTANNTNTVNFAVFDSSPAFRITRIRTPTSNPNVYSLGSVPVGMTVGQSNYTIGVASANLPSSGVTLTITGDGLTLGTATSNVTLFAGLVLWSVPISVASNATPGLRSFILTQETNVAYANGFLEIKPAFPDYNFDGLDDRFQRQYFPVFTAANAGPNADPDGDKMNNYAESVAGTIPTNAASLLTLQSVSRTNTTNTVRWQSVTGKKYQVSYRTNVAVGSWSNIGSTVTATGATSLYTDTTATNTFRFYRVQVLP